MAKPLRLRMARAASALDKRRERFTINPRRESSRRYDSKPDLMRNFLSKIVAMLLTLAATLPMANGADPIEPGQRAAIERFLKASRAVAAIHHFAVPTAIFSAAVEHGGVRVLDVQVPEIEPFLDREALDGQIIAVYGEHFTTEQASGAADFYESPAGLRIMAATLRNFLPSTDPLIQANHAPPTSSDLRQLETFQSGPVGSHLKVVTPKINEELARIVKTAAESAVDQFMSEIGLPERRAPVTPQMQEPQAD